MTLKACKINEVYVKIMVKSREKPENAVVKT